VLGETVTGWQWAGTGLVVAALAVFLLGPLFLQRIGRQPAAAGRE